MKIYLVRHGRQNSKLCNVDVPLSIEGKQQAELAGLRMKNWGIEKIYCSDLIRAVETADIMAQILQVEKEADFRLREIDFGEMAGHSDEENEKLFGFFLKKQRSMKWDMAYPGGECGADVFHRAMTAIESIAKNHKGNVAVITHGVLIRCLLAGILEVDFAKKNIFAKNMENTGITELQYDENENRFTLEHLNDCAHLEEFPWLKRDAWQ